MQKKPEKRVLARLLAEDLELAHGGDGGDAPTVEITQGLAGRDVTNTGPDGD